MRPSTLVVVLLVLLAGCGSLVGVDRTVESTPATETRTIEPTTIEPTTTDTTPPEDPAALAATYEDRADEGLPVNYSLVHARTVTLLDATDVRPPNRVRVVANDAFRSSDRDPAPIRRLLGISRDERPDPPLAYTTRFGVTVNERLFDDPGQTRVVVSHETVHVVQFEQGVFATLDRTVQRPGEPAGLTTGDEQTRTAIIEGAAQWVASVYWATHVETGTDPEAAVERRYRNASVADRMGLAPTLYGQRYVDRRLDDPANLSSVYENPTTTTEQLLDNSRDRPRHLTVVDRADTWRVSPAGRDRKGELFLRVVLSTAVNRSTAATAADGWGNDRLVPFTSTDSNEAGYAWVHRWDDPSEAAEFERIAGRFLNRTATRTTVDTDRGTTPVWTREAGVYRLVRVSAEKTVLLFGNATFVREIAPTGNDSTVTIRASDESTRLTGTRGPPTAEPVRSAHDSGVVYEQQATLSNSARRYRHTASDE